MGAGLSPFWFGFYDASVWVPIGLAVVSACAMALMARPLRLTGPSAVVLGASLALALWTLASSRWAESAHEAVLSGNRALVLVAVLALAFALVRTERRALLMVGAVGFGIAVVALWVELRLLQDTESLFQGGRLNRPLGYVNAEGTIFVIGLWIAFALAELRRPLVAGAGAGLATFAGGLVLLSQSRGAALAVLVSGLVLLAVGARAPAADRPHGRRQRHRRGLLRTVARRLRIAARHGDRRRCGVGRRTGPARCFGLRRAALGES